MNRTTVVKGGAEVDVCASPRPSGTELHVTARPEGPGRGDAEAVLEALAGAIVERRGAPLQEKLYGSLAARGDVLRIRDAVYRRRGIDPELPLTWIEGLPLAGEPLVGAQVWAVEPASGSTVRTIRAGTGRGRLWEGEGFRVLHLAEVTGARPDGTRPESGPDQARQMFVNAGEGLRSQGMAYRDVARTWIYLSRLLEWYGELNAVRTAHYLPEGLGEGRVAFPASTGIQGRTGTEECLMDVLAVQVSPGGRASVTPIHRSPRQDQSFRYGSAFSRGMTIAIDGVRTIHISGTASIDATGASTHLGDPEMQSVETLLSIAAILEEHGGSLADITSATLYCKDDRAFEAWERVSRLLRVPPFPRISVRADVCRDDLLVELEAVAVIGAAAGA